MIRSICVILGLAFCLPLGRAEGVEPDSSAAGRLFLTLEKRLLDSESFRLLSEIESTGSVQFTMAGSLRPKRPCGSIRLPADRFGANRSFTSRMATWSSWRSTPSSSSIRRPIQTSFSLPTEPAAIVEGELRESGHHPHAA